MNSLSVVVVDDEKLIASMVEVWLSGRPGFTIVGTAFNGNDGLELCRKLQPDIVLLDIEMPGMDGLEVARHLRQEIPKTKIIVLTSHFDPFCVHEISQLGVQGYVDKGSSLEILDQAIRHVAQGERYYAPVYQTVKDSQLSQPSAFHKVITPKEQSVLTLLANGDDDDSIARQLKISPDTVATHRRNLRGKLGAHNDRDLVNYARQWGLLPLALPDPPP